MIARLVLLVLLAPLLGACETLKGSVAGSCGVFERPPYAVRGKTPYDQDVADKFVESGVAGCNWPRPAARPASLDAPISRKAFAPAPVKRRGIVKRIRDRILPAEKPPVAAAPIAPLPEPVQPDSAPDPPAPKPRSLIDQLLLPGR